MSLKETISSLDFFSKLNDKDIQKLSLFSNLHKYEKDYILYFEKQSTSKLFFMVTGQAKAYKLDKNNNEINQVVFDLNKEESKGTRKFFKISAAILNTLRDGKILIIDELDASLHPMLTRHLIKLFHNDKVNTKNAQLIFATHDTNLLTKTMFRRDQIWLTEKDKFGVTDIYSLAQFKNVRKNEDFEKQYIYGKYGAIPYLGKFEF